MQIYQNNPAAPMNVAWVKSGQDWPQKVARIEGSQSLADSVAFLEKDVIWNRNCTMRGWSWDGGRCSVTPSAKGQWRRSGLPRCQRVRRWTRSARRPSMWIWNQCFFNINYELRVTILKSKLFSGKDFIYKLGTAVSVFRGHSNNTWHFPNFT